MAAPLDGAFAGRLQALKEGLLPYLKGKHQLLEESPAGPDITPEPDSPRAYTPGDDVRLIDWSLYARLNKLYLKTTTREEEVPYVVLLDCSESMARPDPGKFATALQVTAALADVLLALGHRVVIVPWSTGAAARHGPYAGEGEMAEVLRVLGTTRTGGASDLRRALADAVPSSASFKAALVIVSDFLFPLDYRSEIEHLAGAALPLAALRVMTREEEGARMRGNLVLIDPETGAEEPLHATYAAARRYQEALRAHLAEVESLFRRQGAAFHHALPTQPFEAIVKRMMV